MRVPERIFAPGTVAAYSNYGAALAGYIVQRVSGEPFDAYVERHITRPLAMPHTTFVQPLPAALAPRMSSGYRLASGGAMPFELMLSPAGGAAATATDIARFMLAHLGRGSLDGVRILQPATASMMHASHHAFDARDNSSSLGWAKFRHNGQGLIGHDGATFYFHSNLVLIPDAGVGIFVAYNSSGNGAEGTIGPVFRAFMDRYFPYAPAPVTAAPLPAGHVPDFSGYYMSSRRGESNLAYLGALFGQTRVVANGDGTIKAGKLLGGPQPAISWRQTAPGFWTDNVGSQARGSTSRCASCSWPGGPARSP
ncbi:serine hydrolase domain-containing protein [Massilia cavernae]|uniref:Class A beta-lactamase-related serine hydrolase n=1 Tax=Massilia cavernae TaxID=2320864 RepID=A0A418XXT2_9BURK|nr:serine hydrolase domain-containing protein [Massilia cavernae]RJG17649.1 class A beta-lactamase-related serine hydrolase [Massilia cavernae]